MIALKLKPLPGREISVAALRIELAWLCETQPRPSPSRPPLESEADLGFTLSESLYAAAVLDLLKQSDVDGAVEWVISNRSTLSAHRDFGAEPWEVVAHIVREAYWATALQTQNRHRQPTGLVSKKVQVNVSRENNGALDFSA